MAILEDLGLEVKILVNNSPLQEYEDKDAGATDDKFGNEIRKCRQYVEVIENAEFAVQLRVTPANNYLNNESERIAFFIDLDGHRQLGSRLLNSDQKQVLVDGKVEYEGQTSVSRRKFRFSTVKTVDEDDKERVHKDAKLAKGLGLIRVRVFRGVRVEATESNVLDVLGQLPESDEEFDEMENRLAEKALKGKALSHRATLSAPVPTHDITKVVFEYVDPVDVPLAVFYFKYRSKAALQDEMIIPRSREASHQPTPVESLSLTEVRRLASERLSNMPYHELLRLARLQSSGIKASPEENSAPLRPAIKRDQSELQISERPQKTVKISGGREAIDLTDDD